MSTDGWSVLEGVTPQSSWPARAKLAGESIILVDTGSGLRGIERACPHQKATMMDSTLMANGKMIRCFLHNYTFKLSDGKGVNCPGFRLRVFEVREEEGTLLGREVPS